jgi:hypothetical protein
MVAGSPKIAKDGWTLTSKLADCYKRLSAAGGAACSGFVREVRLGSALNLQDLAGRSITCSDCSSLKENADGASAHRRTSMCEGYNTFGIEVKGNFMG